MNIDQIATLCVMIAGLAVLVLAVVSPFRGNMYGWAPSLSLLWVVTLVSALMTTSESGGGATAFKLLLPFTLAYTGLCFYGDRRYKRRHPEVPTSESTAHGV